MQIKKTEIVLYTAYMLGVPDIYLKNYTKTYDEYIDALRSNTNMSCIRCLTKIRTTFLRYFDKINAMMRYDLKNISSIDFFDQDDIAYLKKQNIIIEQANYTCEKYLLDINKIIIDIIDKCSDEFKDWQRFDLIKKLFVINGYRKDDVMKKERINFIKNISLYPYQMYVYNLPENCGNLLYNDERFLQTLIMANGEQYISNNNCIDANDDVKDNIYRFINNGSKINIVVDCENSNPYKLLSTLRSLEKASIQKISKIILYDDINTDIGWSEFEQCVGLPVEHIMVERVVERKSLVDINLSVNVCKQFYAEHVDSFIIVSSDSDYWGLISSLPDAKFMVMYEYSQCGNAIKDVLSEHGYYYCAIDDFCSGNIDDLVSTVILASIEQQLMAINPIDTKQLIKDAYKASKIEASDRDIMCFHDRNIQNISFSFDASGHIRIHNAKSSTN